jgi:hypothetical protein
MMTLTELLPAVRDLPAEDKVKLYHVLAEELSPVEGDSALRCGKVYCLPPLCDAPGAGAILLEELKKAER